MIVISDTGCEDLFHQVFDQVIVSDTFRSLLRLKAEIVNLKKEMSCLL